jgi:AcrR family transcriptional regulator
MPRSKAPVSVKPYHHGDLKQTLLVESERILEKEGIQALTLRAAARAAGVSHAAPTNHFGDITGLLSELAADGFCRLNVALAVAVESTSGDPRAGLAAMGRAYVEFARLHPGLFTLMVRGERLDFQHPALKKAVTVTRATLRDAVAAKSPSQQLSPVKAAAQVTALWALAHGYAVLMLEGRLRATLASLPDHPSATALFEATLDAANFS